MKSMIDNTITLALIGLAVAVVGGAPATITAWAALRQGRVAVAKVEAVATKVDTAVLPQIQAVSDKVLENTNKVDEGNAKTDALAATAENISHATDGNLSKMTANWQMAMMEIKGLKAQVAQMISSREDTRHATETAAIRKDLAREQAARGDADIRAMEGLQELSDTKVALSKAEMAPAISPTQGALS